MVARSKAHATSGISPLAQVSQAHQRGAVLKWRTRSLMSGIGVAALVAGGAAAATRRRKRNKGNRND